MKTFSYTASLKLKMDDPPLEVLQDKLPRMTDIVLTSRSFSDYGECVHSCKKLLDDFTKRAAPGEGVLQVGAEVNPAVSGEPTISKNWLPDEVARFWVVNSAAESTTTILAVAQARIFSETGGSYLPN